jgi:hypothetical protein
MVSPHRAVVAPLANYLWTLRREQPDLTLLVVVPEIVGRHWWHYVLHDHIAPRLKRTLRALPGVTVTSVPFQLEERPRRCDWVASGVRLERDWPATGAHGRQKTGHAGSGPQLAANAVSASLMSREYEEGRRWLRSSGAVLTAEATIPSGSFTPSPAGALTLLRSTAPNGIASCAGQPC